MTDISNTDNVIDSRDIIARIEYLESLLEGEEENEEYDDEIEELEQLNKVKEQAQHSPDWIYGETMINEDYFVEYIEELITECYELPKELSSGNWPWRHVTIDYDAAAEEAKQDYMEVDFDGNTFYVRS